MDTYLLVKLNMSYAEFEVDAFWVTTQQEYDQFLKKVSNYDWSESDEIYFGTNEWINFYSTDELIDSLEVTPITQEFYSQLIAHFGETYGLISIPYLAEYINNKEKW